MRKGRGAAILIPAAKRDAHKLAMRKLHHCNECGKDHKPKGSGSCPYVRQAKMIAASRGPDEPWESYVDVQVIELDSSAYLSESGTGSVKPDQAAADDDDEGSGHGESNSDTEVTKEGTGGGAGPPRKKLTEAEIEGMLVDFVGDFKASRQVMQQTMSVLTGLVSHMSLGGVPGASHVAGGQPPLYAPVPPTQPQFQHVQQQYPSFSGQFQQAPSVLLQGPSSQQNTGGSQAAPSQSPGNTRPSGAVGTGTAGGAAGAQAGQGQAAPGGVHSPPQPGVPAPQQQQQWPSQQVPDPLSYPQQVYPQQQWPQPQHIQQAQQLQQQQQQFPYAVPAGLLYPPVALMSGTPSRSVLYGNVPVQPQLQLAAVCPGGAGQCGSRTRRRKCVYFDLDPHLHADKTKEPSLNDLISASMSLLSSMMARGHGVQNYAKHIRFLSDKAGVYDHRALIDYDYAMRERADIFGESSFCYADHDLFNDHVGLENLVRHGGRSGGSGAASGGSRGRGGGRRRPNTSPRRSKAGACWGFNKESGCDYGVDCRYPHHCTSCGGNHSRLKCTKSKSDQDHSSA